MPIPTTTSQHDTSKKTSAEQTSTSSAVPLKTIGGVEAGQQTSCSSSQALKTSPMTTTTTASETATMNKPPTISHPLEGSNNGAKSGVARARSPNIGVQANGATKVSTVEVPSMADARAQQRSPSESKRKEVDENNPPTSGGNGAAAETNQTSKGRKSSRKGSKKKEKVQSINIESGDEGKRSSDGIQSEPPSNQQNTTVATTTDGQPEASNKTGAHDKNSNKSCCFCWCCCCSCSCPAPLSFTSLSVKNGKATKDPNKNQQSPLEHYFNGNEDLPPSVDEVRAWAESFDKLMKCPWGRKVFRDFLKCEYSEENILFWLACEELRNEGNVDLVEEKARGIYEDYISILSPKEVSLDSRVRDIINKNMVKPTRETFDEAQLQIYTLMHRDSYPRFINSPMFRKLAQLPSPSRKGSAA